MYISLDSTIYNLERIYRSFFNEWITADFSRVSSDAKELFSVIQEDFSSLIWELKDSRDQFLRDDDGA